MVYSNRLTQKDSPGSKRHGIVPRPTEDPTDPLRWPTWYKVMAIVTASIFNFTANFASSTFTVAVPIWSEEFRRSPTVTNSLVSEFNFLLLGLGNMFWVPVATKIGKRVALLSAMIILCATQLWIAESRSFGSLLAARCVAGFASAAGESVVPGMVGDIFYVHEHASYMAIYIVFITNGSALGPLIGGFVCALTANSWRNVAWVSFTLSGLTALLILFLCPETSFQRRVSSSQRVDSTATLPNKNQSAPSHGHREGARLDDDMPRGVSYVPWQKIWRSSLWYNNRLSWTAAFIRPWVVVAYPPVLWVTVLYGTLLAPQVALTIAFPSLLQQSPYFWPSSNVGLMQVAAIVGFLVACFGGGYMSDKTFMRANRGKDTSLPERRLISLLPGFMIGPAGCILVAFACERRLHWSAIAIGFGMISFGSVYSPNIAITYLIDCFPPLSTELLVIVNVLKNCIAFTLIYVEAEWISSSGYLEMFMIMFMLTMVSALLALPLYFFGSRVRRLCNQIYDPEKSSDQ